VRERVQKLSRRPGEVLLRRRRRAWRIGQLTARPFQPSGARRRPRGMLTDQRKAAIDNLADDELEYEVARGRASRFKGASCQGPATSKDARSKHWPSKPRWMPPRLA
jgi:hypothetical protein